MEVTCFQYYKLTYRETHVARAFESPSQQQAGIEALGQTILYEEQILPTMT